MADFSDVLDCNRAYEVADEVIHDLVDACGEILYDNYVANKVRNVALDHVMHEINAALRCMNLPHDVGEQGVSWLAGEDPQCAPIDTWGRQAVPSKKKKAQSFLSDMRDQNSPTSPSVGSRSRSSRRTGRSRRGSARGGEKEQSRPEVIMSSSAAAPNARPSVVLPQSHHVEAKSEETLAFELMQQQERERIEQLRREQAEEDARYQALQEELKGKEYTFDAEGNLIVIGRVNMEKAGGLSHLVGADRFHVMDDEPRAGDIPAAAAAAALEEAAALAAEKASSTRRRSSKKRTKRRGPSSATSSPKGDANSSHFVADPAKQPPLLNTIRLVPGVTLKEGNSAKAGPKKPENTLHMSRKDFQAHQGRLSERGQTPATDGFEDPLNATLPLDDMDAAAGSRRKSQTPEDEEEKFYDPNVELISSGDWGANVQSGEEYNPGVLPDRPGSQQIRRLELTLGRTYNKPRDRPHTKMAIEPDPSNIKLPPIKQIPEHLKSPHIMKERKDKAFGRSKNRLTVTNRKAMETLGGSPQGQ